MPNSRKPQKPPSILLIGWTSTGRIITIQDPSPALMAALEGMKR
jgi:hypothetical protein